MNPKKIETYLNTGRNEGSLRTNTHSVLVSLNQFIRGLPIFEALILQANSKIWVKELFHYETKLIDY